MKIFPSSFLILLLFFNNTTAQAATLAGINWADTDEIIISKMNSIGRFIHMKQQMIVQSKSIDLCNPDIAMSKTDKLNSASNYKQESPQDKLDTLIFNSIEENNYIELIEFTRSGETGKLLSIEIFFNTRQIQKNGSDLVGRFLKLYGTPSRVIRDIFQWNIDNVEIHAGESNDNLAYYHLKSIREHCKACRNP